jgi:hypothetical protein
MFEILPAFSSLEVKRLKFIQTLWHKGIAGNCS